MTLIGGLGLLLAALPYVLYPLDDSTTGGTFIPDLCILGNVLLASGKNNVSAVTQACKSRLLTCKGHLSLMIGI